jgi:hypothetical protein
VSLIMPHIGYEDIVYARADAASQRRLNTAFRDCLRYIHSLRRLDHASHLATSVMDASLADYARIQLLLFLYKVLHVRHPCYLAVPVHRSHTQLISQSNSVQKI